MLRQQEQNQPREEAVAPQVKRTWLRRHDTEGTTVSELLRPGIPRAAGDAEPPRRDLTIVSTVCAPRSLHPLAVEAR